MVSEGVSAQRSFLRKSVFSAVQTQFNFSRKERKAREEILAIEGVSAQ
jgi:hypothetical protein